MSFLDGFKSPHPLLRGLTEDKDATLRLATVVSVEDDGATVAFEGDLDEAGNPIVSAAVYPTLNSYDATEDDRVVMIRQGRTWVILGALGDYTAGGVTDHGELTGLDEDDHTQYALADGSRGNFAASTHTHSQSDVTGLTAALAALPKGYVAEGTSTTDQTNITEATLSTVVTSATVESGRRYKVTGSVTARNSSATPATMHVSVYATGSATGQARIGSFRSNGSTTYTDRNQVTGYTILTWPSGGTYTVGLALEPSGSNWQILNSSGTPGRILVEDIGPA